jgi:hypothetical protein
VKTKLIRFAVIGLGCLALLGGAVVAGGIWWVKGRLSREAVVAQLEGMWDARVALGESELLMWRSPARLRLGKLDLWSRQAGLENEPPVVHLDEVVLEVSLLDLLRRTLDVKSLHLVGLEVKEYVSPEGGSQLQAMLKKPGSVSVAGAVGVPASKVEVDRVAKVGKEKPAVFQAEQLGMTVRIHEARISNSRFFLHNRVNKTKTRMENVNFALTAIDVDPGDLANHNEAAVELQMELTMEGRGKVGGEMQDVQFAKLLVRGQGKMQPFEVETQAWNPISEWEVTLGQGSVLAGYMTMGQASADGGKKMQEFGLDISDMPVGGELLEDAVVRMAMTQGRMTLLEDARFVMPEYEVRMAEGSWLDSAKDAQDQVIRLVCGEELERRMRAGMLANGLSEGMVDSLVKGLRDEKAGRLAFDVRAVGQMTKPKITVAWDRALEQLFKNDGLPGLLKGLIKK